MEKALVSIIVTCFNTEKFLPRCLDSNFNSTYRNIEVILIDDGSNNPVDIFVESYLSRYKNLKSKFATGNP